jgi:hypothetical protein
MKLYTTFVATAALAVSPASSSMTPAEYHSLPTLDTDEMRADFLSVIRPRHHHQRVLFHDEPNPFSPKCILTEQLLTLAAEPPTLPTPSNDTETRTLDYAADQNAFDAFDSDCNSLGGQTLTYDMEVSDGCGLEFLRLLNFPHCFGSACDEDDIALFGTMNINDVLANPDASDSCTASITVESDGADGVEPFGPPCLTDECLDDSLRMYFNEDVYDEEVWGTISKEDDEYTEYLANFEESCENESGRFVVGSVTSVGPCATLSFISQPICLAKSSCGYEESRVAEEFIWDIRLEFFDCGEDVVTVTLEEEFGSKSSKSSKKSKKCEKSNKVPKSSLRKGRK